MEKTPEKKVVKPAVKLTMHRLHHIGLTDLIEYGKGEFGEQKVNEALREIVGRYEERIRQSALLYPVAGKGKFGTDEDL